MTPHRCRAMSAGIAGILAACLLAGALVLPGCSDAPENDVSDAVKGKTPVVRPEDVHGRGGGAAVLAPDYRQALAADLDATANSPDPAAKTAPGKASNTGLAGTAPVADKTTAPATPEAPASGTARSSGFPVAGCRQLVLVTAAGMDATSGTLRQFERKGPDAPWREVAAASCLLGRKGLGAGRGLGDPVPGPSKRGGDGRTPSGIFRLPAAFGYADPESARRAGVRLPYERVTDRTACIDEPGSALYGRVIGPDKRSEGARMHQERMYRKDGANVWGVVIGHNQENPDPQAGTCLFVNVRPEGGSATGGSIGLPETRAAALAAWLDPAAEPLLAVLPEGLYRQLRTAWGLP